MSKGEGKFGTKGLQDKGIEADLFGMGLGELKLCL